MYRKSYYNYLEGAFPFTEGTKAGFIKELISEQGLQRYELWNISVFYTPFELHVYARHSRKCYRHKNEQETDFPLTSNCSQSSKKNKIHYYFLLCFDFASVQLHFSFPFNETTIYLKKKKGTFHLLPPLGVGRFLVQISGSYVGNT